MLNFQFKDNSLLEQALTHSSKSPDNYERLEFLGDSILDFVVGEFLFKNCEEDEGYLTKKRSGFVSENYLAKIFDSFEITDQIRVGKCYKGEISKAVKADIYEAIVAAIYLDSGLSKARAFVIKTLKLKNFRKLQSNDFKTLLQESVQAEFKCNVTYKTKSSTKGDGFNAEVYMDEDKISTGKGNSKLEAEQAAAKRAFNKLFTD